MGASTPPTLPLAPEILAAIDRNATLLTPNQRSARTLHRAFALAQQARGVAHWATPQIYALDTWLPTLWHRILLAGADSRILLNPIQEQTLWRTIIAADREISTLRSTDSLATLAARAFRLLHFYNGRDQLAVAAHSTDTRAFDRWTRAFDRLCARELYLTHAQLPAALDQAIAGGDLDLPNAGLALIDFDPHPPAIASLLHSIETAGYEVESISTSSTLTTPTLHPVHDPTTELPAAAIWSRTLLAANPQTRIAIVVPDLADRRPELERTFAETLPRDSFEFSLGIPLAQTSLTATYLDLLRWTLDPLPLDRINALLLSAHFAVQSEPLAEFDARDLRQAKLLRPELSLEDTLEILRNSPRKPRLPQLHARLRTLRKTNLTDSNPHPHAHWAEAFREVLATTVRPPEDSLAFQTHRRWESALDQLATLDFNGLRLTAREALESLTRIATQTIFAPESTNAPIQILGPLELGAVPFDALWFLSADDQTWPVPAAANPLLPFDLQRRLSMPAADTDRDTLLAQSITRRIARSAATVIFSYATQAEDGPRRPSPLIQAISANHSVPHSSPLSGDEWVQPTLPLEVISDTLSIHSIPSATLRGGAKVLELQAACPFRAFAERRLYSAELDATEPGLDSRESGSLVHHVMQSFWRELKTQQALRDLPLAARHAALDDAIEEALTLTQRQIRGPWDAAYLDVQRQRLRNLLRPWLTVELDRPPFTVIATEHETKAATIGPLTLDLRVDRIDQTPSGTLILDYKTGSASPADWLSDRPDAPQLPLYAVLAASTPNNAGIPIVVIPEGNPRLETTEVGVGAPGLASETWENATNRVSMNASVPHSSQLHRDEWVPTNLAGVAFAILRAGDDLKLKGFADTPSVFGKTDRMPKPTLQAQLEDWYQILEGLAGDFAHGNPAPLPKNYPHTCKHCDQRILCRLNPADLPQFGDDEEDPEAIHFA